MNSPKKQKSPDQTLGKGDPGDDVQRRFRYQAAVAAHICVQMLDENGVIEEVYCEQHDDVLVKLKNGAFDGIQVKTRAGATKGLFTSSDDDIKQAIARFVFLDNEFPGKFSRFLLATNERFWQRKKDASNLPYLIGIAKEQLDGKVSEGSKLVSDYSEKIRELMDLDDKKVAATLAKIQTVEYSKLNDMVLRLMEDLIKVKPELGGCPHAQLRSVAEAMIDSTSAAARACKDDSIKAYFVFCDDPEASIDSSVIESKRITSTLLDEIIRKVLTYEYTLPSRNQASISTLSSTARNTERKLSTGGVSRPSVILAKENKTHAEYLLTQWVHKFGVDEADRRYQHLRSVALTECTEAFDEVYSLDRLFGPRMLQKGLIRQVRISWCERHRS